MHFKTGCDALYIHLWANDHIMCVLLVAVVVAGDNNYYNYKC